MNPRTLPRNTTAIISRTLRKMSRHCRIARATPGLSSHHFALFNRKAGPFKKTMALSSATAGYFKKNVALFNLNLP